ncbi:MAG: pyruvate:ferredoxin (flavodoxin) oxidoreductase [Eubacteriaceae bacterium]|nr:pyruvate:ferredoxin (flavodoxin) oxidoreductase [Eubacteriaceae bacterium]
MPKKMKTMDGNTAAAYVSYAFTEVAAIYPITPSSNMAEAVDEWSAQGKENVFGQKVEVVEMQSEAGAAGAVHGSLSAGSLTTTYTASQGLLLMIPNMYKIAGEILPAVFHVSARAVAGHALSIFGDHSDVMATRQTGFIMLASNSVQEAMDLGSVAHLSAIKSSMPVLHFFDGFRTSHETQNINVIEYEDLARLIDKDALASFKARAMNPENPFTKGTAQNPDIFFQAKEASNKFYDAIPDIVVEYMSKISELTGREYKPFQYYGDPGAENIIVAMGSVCETIEETIDYLAEKGEKTGLVKVRLYRPFNEKMFLDSMPKTVKKIAVLDRTKEPGAPGEPLYLDVRNTLYSQPNHAIVVGGRYGLGSKDTKPNQIIAVFENLKLDTPKNGFTIGIVDDVTMLSLEVGEKIDTTPEGTKSCMFWGLGSDGTVSANKSAIKIIGDNTGMFAQAYFDYDSKKSGGLTSSHLRFGNSPIRSPYLIDAADIVSCSMQSYVYQYDMVSNLKDGGIFLLNTHWNQQELETNLPSDYKRIIAEKNIQFYTIDATKIAEEVGLGRRTNMIMESAFFKLSDVIPYDIAEANLKEEVVYNYGKKGDDIVQMNYKGIDQAIASLVEIEVPADWKLARDSIKTDTDVPEFIEQVLRPMTRKLGDSLPVSTFAGIEDGRFPAGTSAYEKRNIAINVPTWIAENCTQCNFCSMACPHAAIRPILLDEDDKKDAPEGFNSIKAVGKDLASYSFRMQVSPMDCTGCEVCVEICPSKKNSLKMEPVANVEGEKANWDYSVNIGEKKVDTNRFTVKGSQFFPPLLEFSGACEGCGETPYAKLVTQLFGERMYIANATGCTSIWGASAPSTPYTKNSDGKGPAWANSLFEDNAEYGYGIYLSVKKQRDLLAMKTRELAEIVEDSGVAAAANKWLELMEDPQGSADAGEELVKALEAFDAKGGLQEELKGYILHSKSHMAKKSVWIFGGDGWAYDIGYGGLDHVLASGENVNILVFDTEVYSNTGGQSSKATPTAAVAKFAAQGKKTKKKDLGMMAAAYGYVYVAQVSMGASMTQLMKVLKEAEEYDGPSLIIAYSPCINHGIRIGMGSSLEQSKKAVECGYWHLYRYNPDLAKQGKNPFILDSKEPKGDFIAYLNTESRYSSLKITFPEIADQLFEKTANDAKDRLDTYKRMAAMS